MLGQSLHVLRKRECRMSRIDIICKNQMSAHFYCFRSFGTHTLMGAENNI